MTGAGCGGKREAGCGPEETVAALKPGAGAAAKGEGATGSVERGAGAGAVPIPGPMAFTSCLCAMILEIVMLQRR